MILLHAKVILLVVQDGDCISLSDILAIEMPMV